MKVRFDKEVLEKTLAKVYKATDDFKIFRYAELKKKKKAPKAWFVVRFSLKHMDEKVYDKLGSVDYKIGVGEQPICVF